MAWLIDRKINLWMANDWIVFKTINLNVGYIFFLSLHRNAVGAYTLRQRKILNWKSGDSNFQVSNNNSVWKLTSTFDFQQISTWKNERVEPTQYMYLRLHRALCTNFIYLYINGKQFGRPNEESHSCSCILKRVSSLCWVSFFRMEFTEYKWKFNYLIAPKLIIAKCPRMQ